MHDKLKRDGYITKDNKVICSLKEFNDYRQYLTSIKLDFEKSYLREQKILEKEVAKLDSPETGGECLNIPHKIKKNLRGKRGPRRHKFLEMLTEELERAAEDTHGHRWTQEGIRERESHRRKLLLRAKLEEDWKLQEMLLLMRIGQDVRRESKLEAQVKRCKDERAKKKQLLLQKRMAYHFDKMQRLVRRREQNEKMPRKQLKIDNSSPKSPRRMSPLRQENNAGKTPSSTAKATFPKPYNQILKMPQKDARPIVVQRVTQHDFRLPDFLQMKEQMLVPGNENVMPAKKKETPPVIRSPKSVSIPTSGTSPVFTPGSVSGPMHGSTPGPTPGLSPVSTTRPTTGPTPGSTPGQIHRPTPGSTPAPTPAQEKGEETHEVLQKTAVVMTCFHTLGVQTSETLLIQAKDQAIVDPAGFPATEPFTNQQGDTLVSKEKKDVKDGLQETGDVKHEGVEAMKHEGALPMKHEGVLPVKPEGEKPVKHEVEDTVKHDVSQPVKHDGAQPVKHEGVKRMPNLQIPDVSISEMLTGEEHFDSTCILLSNTIAELQDGIFMNRLQGDVLSRNSFLNLLKPDVSKVELLKDVQSKHELLVRLVTHDIEQHDEDDEDIEEIVLKESCLIGSEDELHFETPLAFKAKLQSIEPNSTAKDCEKHRDSTYSAVNLERKSPLLSVHRKAKLTKASSDTDESSSGFDVLPFNFSDEKNETPLIGLQSSPPGKIGRERERLDMAAGILAWDSIRTSRSNVVKSSKHDFFKCDPSDASSLDIEEITDSTLPSPGPPGSSVNTVPTQAEKLSVFTKMSTALSRVFLRKSTSTAPMADDTV